MGQRHSIIPAALLSQPEDPAAALLVSAPHTLPGSAAWTPGHRQDSLQQSAAQLLSLSCSAAVWHCVSCGSAGHGSHWVHLSEGSCPLQSSCVRSQSRRASTGWIIKLSLWTNWNYFVQIEVLQDQTGLMLQEYCNSRQSLQTSNKVRINRLLLTLIPINAIEKKLLETIFFQRTLGNVAVDKLVMDLLQVTLHPSYKKKLLRSNILGLGWWRRDFSSIWCLHISIYTMIV